MCIGESNGGCNDFLLLFPLPKDGLNLGWHLLWFYWIYWVIFFTGYDLESKENKAR